MSYLIVLVTTPDRKTSEIISKGLISKKLAACVNRISGIHSRYRWKGKVETAREELLLIKTRSSRLAALTQWVRKNHPYEVCEVVALPIQGGNKAYLDWISKSLKR
jgi:periplasmic divalent cation tolerance protein